MIQSVNACDVIMKSSMQVHVFGIKVKHNNAQQLFDCEFAKMQQWHVIAMDRSTDSEFLTSGS